MLRALPLLILLIAGPAWADGDDANDSPSEPPALISAGHRFLSVDRREHDFGNAGQRQQLYAEFTLTNTSTEKLERIRVKADCGCNSVELADKELEPNASTTLKVGFSTGTLSGTIVKKVRVEGGDKSLGEALLTLRISIVSGLVLAPGAAMFGDVLHGTLPEKTVAVKWRDGVGEPFEITQVSVPGRDDMFDFAVSKLAPPVNSPWRGWSLKLTFKRPPPIGMFSAEVLVRTSHPDEAYRRVIFPLNANVCGKVWMQARTLTFHNVMQGTARSASLTFKPFDASIAFGEVSARSRRILRVQAEDGTVREEIVPGHTRVKVEPDPHHRDKNYWRLTVTVPADAKPGRLTGEWVEIETGAEGQEEIRVAIKGRVRKQRKSSDG